MAPSSTRASRSGCACSMSARLTHHSAVRGVSDDRVDERLGEATVDPLGRTRLRAEAGLAVRAIAGPELIEAAPAHARLPAQLGHRRLVSLGPIEERLPQACETVRRGYGPSSTVDLSINSARVPVGPFILSAASGLIVGRKA